MHKNTTAVLAATTLLGLLLAPAGTSVPSSAPDATIFGPSVFEIKGVLNIGVGTCQEIMNLPGDCTNGSGSISGLGLYIHDTSGCSASIGCIYDIWAIQVGGIEFTGWGISVCTDRDDVALTCTDVGSNNDDLRSGYKGDEITGADKEKKHPDWAHTGFCVRPDVDDGNYDDFYAFITAWVDEDQIFVNDNDNTGSGISYGVYDIYVEYAREALSDEDCDAAGKWNGGRTVNTDP